MYSTSLSWLLLKNHVEFNFCLYCSNYLKIKFVAKFHSLKLWKAQKIEGKDNYWKDGDIKDLILWENKTLLVKRKHGFRFAK